MTSGAAVSPHMRRRAGLGDVPSKLRCRPCTIAYFGASTVVQRHGYRQPLHARLQEATGHEHQMVMAGISGSGSISAAFMVDELVLRHQPELCFVDFLSRDAAAAAAHRSIGPAVEGVVLKLLAHGCAPLFLYMYRRDEERGVYARVLAAWEEVAAHHGIPSVDLGSRVREAVADGSIDLDAIVYDVAHLTPEGGELIAGAIAQAVLSIESGPSAQPRGRLHDAPFSDARVIPAAAVPVRDPDRCEALRFRLFYDYLAIPVGNAFEWAEDAELVGLHVVLGPDTSAVRLTAGAEARDLVMRDDECYYERIATFMFDASYARGTALTIEPIELPAARVDDGLAAHLRVVGFLVR